MYHERDPTTRTSLEAREEKLVSGGHSQEDMVSHILREGHTWTRRQRETLTENENEGDCEIETEVRRRQNKTE